MKNLWESLFKRNSILIGLVVFCFTLFIAGMSCDGCNDDNGTNSLPFLDGEKIALKGHVEKIDGNSIEGVQVVNGNFTSSTDSEGDFQLEASSGLDQVVIFSREGYITTSKFVDFYDGTVTLIKVIMMAEEPAQILNSDTGGTVTGKRSASITAPPGVFVDESGNQVTGDIAVHLTPFDPAVPGEFLAYPGKLRGYTLDGKTVPLVTYGVLDVTVRQNGNDLQIKDGATIQVIVPAPSSGEMPDTSEMWIFDEERGLWLQSDKGDGAYNAGTNTYNASIGHLSPCNVDKPVRATCVSGVVKDSEGNPVAGAFVQAIPIFPDFGRTSSDYTDRNGYICMYVERNTDMIIEVRTQLTDSCPEEMREDSYCVTKREYRSGSSVVNSEYPANCDSNCKTISPSITTEDVDPGPLDEAACVVGAGDQNPFDSTCASGLGDFFECFAPEGACEYEIDIFDPLGSSFVMEFENGSKMESKFTDLGFATYVYGPDPFNEECGKISLTSDGNTKITTASDKSYIIHITDSGTMEMECPGGHTFTLNPDQFDYLAGCSATYGDNGSGVKCKAKAGTFGADCIFDFNCPILGLSCCGSVLGQQTCQIEALCDLICEDDLECEGTTICCSAGEFNMCLPVEACQ